MLKLTTHYGFDEYFDSDMSNDNKIIHFDVYVGKFRYNVCDTGWLLYLPPPPAKFEQMMTCQHVL